MRLADELAPEHLFSASMPFLRSSSYRAAHNVPPVFISRHRKIPMTAATARPVWMYSKKGLPAVTDARRHGIGPSKDTLTRNGHGLTS